MKKIAMSCILAGALFAQESLRSSLGEDIYVQHMNGEVRAGWIEASGSDATFALGGHIHFDTPSYRGLKAGLGFYTASDFGLGPKEANEDFFGTDKKGYTFVSEAYVEYSGVWDIKIGRQNLETPHADSDDIRMVPNYFEAAVARGELWGAKIEAGYITRMGGWENGGKPAKFVRLGKVFGVEQKTDGAAYVGVQGNFASVDLSVWGYHMADMANVLYMEAAKELEWGSVQQHFALQLDIARSCEDKLLGPIHSKTAGIISQTTYQGWTLTLAANKEYGKSGSMASFGGGPFFTSMEDLTIDALASEDAESYVAGVEYSYKEHTFGLMAGRFYDDRAFDAKEYDLYANVSLPYGFEAELVYAKIEENDDRHIARCILKRSF